MKKTILLLLLALPCLQIFAQPQFPDGKHKPEWSVNYRGGFGEPLGTILFKGIIDTVINGKTYTRTNSPSNRTKFVYYRVDTNKVYLFDSSHGIFRDYLIYDFSKKVGDSMILPVFSWDNTIDSFSIKFTGMDSFIDLYYNKIYTMKYTSRNFYPDSGVIYKGIGFSQDPFYFFSKQIIDGDFPAAIVCFDTNSAYLYRNPNYSVCTFTNINEIISDVKPIKIYPNPSSGNIILDPGETEILSVRMTDLFGREVWYNTASEKMRNIDVTGLAEGIYYVSVTSKNATYCNKISIMK